jgi:hypothetical protein
MKKPELLCVSIREAKTNELFTEEQRRSVRFLIYNQRIPCAECGKKAKSMWTLLCQFKALNFNSDSLKESDRSHLPLTPVCKNHSLKPDFKESK